MKHEDGVRCYQYPIEGLYPYVDLYLAETMSCTEEACQVIDALATAKDGDCKHPLLISFTLSGDGKLRSGELVVDCIPKVIKFADQKNVERKCLICDMALCIVFLFHSSTISMLQ
jgi:S-methylmethionine-dependent homocysteine/selenocysteine methylase